MSKLNDFKALFLGVHCPDMRCKGSTTALISIMLANPKAIMIVHTAHVGDNYAKQYGIDRTRFFSIRNGILEFIGRRIEGPILVDLPAIADVLEQVRMEQAEELKAIDTTRLQNRIRTLEVEVEKKSVMIKHLNNRNAQLMGAFKKIDAVLTAPLINPIPEESL